MAFERAALKAPADTATRLISWGLATGLQRQRLKPGSCGGLTRASKKQPRQRLPPCKESDAPGPEAGRVVGSKWYCWLHGTRLYNRLRKQAAWRESGKKN